MQKLSLSLPIPDGLKWHHSFVRGTRTWLICTTPIEHDTVRWAEERPINDEKSPFVIPFHCSSFHLLIKVWHFIILLKCAYKWTNSE